MYPFHDQQELKKFVEPALKTRVRSLIDAGYSMTEDTLFDYFKEEKWKNKKDLHIYEIIHDILNEPIEYTEMKAKE